LFFKTLLIMTFCVAASWADARYSAWAIYWDTAPVHAGYVAYGGSLSTVRLFAYHFNEAGDVIPSSPWIHETHKAWKQSRSGKNQRFLLTFVNDVVAPAGNRLKNPDIVHKVIASSETRKRHIDQILEAAKAFDGVEIDYENVRAGDRDLFTAFIRELAVSLRERKQWLSVVVEPKTEAVTYDGPGSADWASLAEAANELTIMAYFRHHTGGPPGPLAPLLWVTQIAQYALSAAPAEKVTMAFSIDAIDWGPGGGSELTWVSAQNRRASSAARLERPGPDHSPRYLYRMSDAPHEVWFEDALSLREKIQAVHRLGISSISLWRLGSGDPHVWKRLPTHSKRRSQKGTVKYKR